jgi:hypothetical protein
MQRTLRVLRWIARHRKVIGLAGFIGGVGGSVLAAVGHRVLLGTLLATIGFVVVAAMAAIDDPAPGGPPTTDPAIFFWHSTGDAEGG